MPVKKQKKDSPLKADTDAPFDEIVKSLLNVPREKRSSKKPSSPKPKKRKK